MSEKKIIDLGALIIEAMRDETSLMPSCHANGVAIDTICKQEGDKVEVQGYWTAPDTGERYFIAAEVKINPLDFSYCPAGEDTDW